jgi:hypothetical protein
MRVLEHIGDGREYVKLSPRTMADMRRIVSLEAEAVKKTYLPEGIVLLEMADGKIYSIKETKAASVKFVNVERLPVKKDILHIVTESGHEVDMPKALREMLKAEVGGHNIKTLKYPKGWITSKENTEKALKFLADHGIHPVGLYVAEETPAPEKITATLFKDTTVTAEPS